ncbi:MAG: crossover junction endodeoxyribonuclease RuvC [Clostridia bacterium]|nr:crossover junction endodeoxyribonuclease RuvC [Clostridia bacterium]MDH7572770.1 crossover junction endodeoxyribonuclease RuvC [Clostridia bacterium]
MLVMGVDPGLARTGYGLIRRVGRDLVPVAWGCIETPAGEPLPGRLLMLHRQLGELFGRHHPDCLALEQIFFNRNARTAIEVGQARGVVLLAAAEAAVPVEEYNPLTVKQAVTGYGGAEKQQVQKMVHMLLELPVRPEPDDVADALAVAICCLERWYLERRTVAPP